MKPNHSFLRWRKKSNYRYKTCGIPPDKATDGVMRAAFGYGGQKCSACSRVYVQKEIADEFIEKLVEKTKSLKIGLPWEKRCFFGTCNQ